jgi:hypothetical protein
MINLANYQPLTVINLLSDPGAIAGPIVIPNGIKVILNWALNDGKIGHNVIGGAVSGSFSVSAATADALLTGFTTGGPWTAWAAFLAPTCSLTGVTLVDIRVAEQTPISSTGASHPGTSASPEQPDEMAVCVTLRTALAGQGNRGRIYLPGTANNAVAAGNVISAGAITAATNFASNLGTVMTANGLTIALMQPHRAAYTSPVTGRLFPERLATMRPLTQILVRDNHWDSQRRRGLK